MCEAVPRPQLSTTASSAGKNSDTPGSSASGAQDPFFAPGWSGGGSRVSGVSSARPTTSSASYAAAIARAATTRCNSTAFCSLVSADTDRRVPSSGCSPNQATSRSSRADCRCAVDATTRTYGGGTTVSRS